MKKRAGRLSREWCIARNLGIVVLLLVTLWVYYGFPLPTDALRFEWVQRGALMSSPVQLQGAIEVGGSRFLVGADDRNILISQHRGWELREFPRDPGPALAPLPGSIMWDTAWIVAVDVPEGTTSSRLELTASVYYAVGSGIEYSGTPDGLWRYETPSRYWERSYEAEGQMLEDGGIVFCLRPTMEKEGAFQERELEESVLGQLVEWDNYLEENGDARNVNCRMEATFYGEDGNELGRTALSTPKR